MMMTAFAAVGPTLGGNVRSGPMGLSRSRARVAIAVGSRPVRRATLCAASQGAAPMVARDGSGSGGAWRRARMGSASAIAAALGVGIAAAAALLLSPEAAAASAASAAPAMSSNAVVAMLQFVLHLEHHLGEIIAKYGVQVYGILFAIVFCETGLVVTPFLPGDSLLFAAGSFCALDKLSLPLMLGLFMVAAIAGDAVNYAIGKAVGKKAFELDTWFLRKKNLAKTEAFYAKHGPKAIVLARFLPIVRTFAPFVAGVGSMEYKTFALYNVVGAAVWVVGFTMLGFLFGNVPIVQNNFSAVVLGIVAISVVPVVVEIVKAKVEEKSA